MKKLNTCDIVLTSEDLNGQIAEIHRLPLTRSDKKRAFIELGLTDWDLRALYNGIYFNVTAPIRVVSPRGKVYTFGTEIECFVSRDRIYDTASGNKVKIAYERYNHEDGKDYFKFVTDASVRSDNSEEDRNSIECVSPILKGKAGLTTLKRACKSLNQAGATVNSRCGLHVHVGAQNISARAYVNVFKNYQILEGLIDTFMAASRRGNANGYCKSTRGFDFSHCESQSDVLNVLRRDRYFKVNPCAYFAHKTIEFRQHGGTTNFDKISMWVNFCVKLVEWSENNVLTTCPATIADIPFLNDKEKAFFAKRAEELA